MIRVRNWLWQRIDPDGFEAPGAVWRFALATSFRSVIVTILAAFCTLPFLYRFGILTIPVEQMVMLLVAFSWLFGGVLSGSLAFAVGQVIRDLSRSRNEFERLSRTDSLTGLSNRRAFTDALSGVEAGASLGIIDIDRFKRINDRFGHQVGDEVICAIAATLCLVFGAEPLVARLGGEEFGVILTGGSFEQRLALFEQARQAVCDGMQARDGRTLSVTVSIGVAEFLPGRRPEGVYAGADRALYIAKDRGRDRVVHERHLLSGDMPPLDEHDRCCDSRVSSASG